ncbi:suppressor of fused domain protein [Agrobacterium rosae]|uniref:suppressor of fused domain protein n=1 Tax=Agrobacterium rosae TaxID=1972867 RepID=UPI003BA1760A
MALFKFIAGLFRPKEDNKASNQDVVETELTAAEEEQWDEHFFQESCLKRDQFWEAVGQVETDVLTHLISPSLTGGPEWPTTRQAYRVVRRKNTMIIATDGLSDPFRGISGGENGFELELFIETPDVYPDHAGQAGDIASIGKSWAFEIIQNVAGTVAGAGGINEQLDRYTVLSVEVPGVSQSHAVQTQVPKRFITDDDCIGILIGAPKQNFGTEITDMPLSPVRIIPITVITAAELDYIRANGANERIALSEKLTESGIGNVSAFMRPDVI